MLVYERRKNMKKELEAELEMECEEFVEEEMEEVTEDEIAMLSEEELDDTEGGALKLTKTCRGTFTRSGKMSVHTIPVCTRGMILIKSISRVSGPKIRWIALGAGNIMVLRSESKLGVGNYKAYDFLGNWVNIKITWK